MENHIRDAICLINCTIEVAPGGHAQKTLRGTGFLVSEGLVATALHVVAKRQEDGPEFYLGPITLTFPDKRTEGTVEPRSWSVESDFVLLRCKEPPPCRPIPLEDLENSREPWETYGFPDAQPVDGMVFTGSVVNLNAKLDGVPVFQLFCREAAAGTGAPVRGLSGAPVLVGDAAIGLLRYALMKEQRTVAGTVYGCPARAIVKASSGRLKLRPHKVTYSLQALPFPRLDYRSLIDDLISYYMTIFVDREETLREISLMTVEAAPGYMLIDAPMGFGKSALIARMVHCHETGQWGHPSVPRLVYYFVRQHGSMPEDFLQAVNSQLLNLLDEPGGVPSDLRALRAQFSQLWSHVLKEACQERPLLMLIDGLDEQQQGNVTIAHALPSTLTNYVHVVITSRPNPDPVDLVPLEHPLRRTRPLKLKDFGEDDIKALLLQQGASVDIATLLAPRVRTMTNGEPLLARFVTQDVVALGEVALARLEDNPPRDVEAYFRDQFAQLDKAKKGEHTWDVLGLLVVARGSMAVDEIADILALGIHETRMALEPIQRYLLGSSSYQLQYWLRRVVEGDFSKSEQTAYRQKIVTWCQQFQMHHWPPETPAYVLNHYAEHLREGRQHDQLYALISRSWMRTQFQHTFSYRLFAHDVDVAFDAAITEPADVVQQVRMCLLFATLEAFATRIPANVLSALTWIGECASAEDFAFLKKNGTDRGRAYYLIGAALEQKGDKEHARTILLRALDAVSENLEDIGAVDTAIDTMRSLARSGDPDLARKRATTILDGKDRVRALAMIAEVAKDGGKHETARDVAREAVAAAETLADDVDRLTALATAARAVARSGDRDRVRVLEQSIFPAIDAMEDRRSADRTRSDLAEALVEIGDVHRAVSVAEPIVDRTDRVKTMVNMARIALRRGERESAESIIKKVRELTDGDGHDRYDEDVDVHERVRIQMALAQILVETGDSASAQQVLVDLHEAVATINNCFLEEIVLQEIAPLLLRLGESDEAVSLAQSIRSPSTRAEALISIAQSALRTGDRPTACAVARLVLSEGKSQVSLWVLGNLAALLAEAGDVNEARALVVEVIASTEATLERNETECVGLLVEIAQVLARRGVTEQARHVAREARATAERIPDAYGSEERRSWALGRAAIAQTVAGDIDQALSTDFLEFWQSRLRRSMTEALARSGQLDSAEYLAAQIFDQSERVQALIAVASAFAEGDKIPKAIKLLDDAVAAAHEIGDEADGGYSRVSSLAAIVPALFDIGQTHRARDVAREAFSLASAIHDDSLANWRTRALAEVIPALAVGDTVNAALEAVNIMGDDFWTRKALATAVHALAARKDCDGAVMVSHRIERSLDKLRALIEIRDALVHAGQRASAEELTRQTRDLIANMEAQGWKGSTFSERVTLLVGAGAQDHARKLAIEALTALDAMTGQIEVLELERSKIASALAEAGMYDEALAAADGSSGSFRARILGDVARALFNAHEEERAQRVWQDALAAAHVSRREDVFRVVAAGVPLLEAQGGTETIWKLYDSIMEVERWWGAAPQSAT